MWADQLKGVPFDKLEKLAASEGRLMGAGWIQERLVLPAE